MRNKFTDLIHQGVAQFNYTPIAPQVPEQDMICRIYNNIWSIPSDTHMHMDVDGTRYITGHMVGIASKWEQFVGSAFWGAVNFRSSGYWCLADFLHQNGLCGSLDTLNGDVVYRVSPCAPENLGPVACPNCAVTTESKIPMPVATLSHDGNALHIKECYNNKSNLYEVCEAMNDSVYVKGKNWTVNGDNIMCPIGNKVYVL